MLLRVFIFIGYEISMCAMSPLQVKFVEHQTLRKMVKKGYQVPNDPDWYKQWFLVSSL